MSVSQATRPPNKLLTLLFVLRCNPSLQVLLGYKKRGFAQGRWNGFGGKVQPDESIEDAAVRCSKAYIVGFTALVVLFHRETKEECGLDVTVTNLDKVGVLQFEFVNEPQILEVHVFRTTQFSGEVTESEGIVTEQSNNYFK